MTRPTIKLDADSAPIEAGGESFVIREWHGSGPAELHVHHSDDEAWHVLAGSVRFRFDDHEIDAPEGSTVFVPAGVAHTFLAATDETRYLLILTQRLLSLIESLGPGQSHEEKAAIYLAHASELLE